MLFVPINLNLMDANVAFMLMTRAVGAPLTARDGDAVL